MQGTPEGPQTPGTSVKCGPDPTTTLPKLEDGSGGALSLGHRPVGKLTQGSTEVASPGSGLNRGQEESGGAPEKSEMVGSMPHSFELKRTVPRSLAGKFPGQPSAEVSGSPLPPEEALGTTTPWSVKRKVTTPGNISPESGTALKTLGGGKRLKRSTDKDTPRRTSARKAIERLKRTMEGDAPLQSSAPQEVKTGAVSSDRSTKEHKAPSFVLPQTFRRIKLRRR